MYYFTKLRSGKGDPKIENLVKSNSNNMIAGADYIVILVMHFIMLY